MLEAVNITKTYRQFQALRGLNFNVSHKTIVGLLGPNGAGKTTTMRILTTFLQPSSGTARVAGFDILKDPESVRRNIGYLPENPPLYDEMKTLDYLRFIARLRGVESHSRKQRIEEVIALCGLGGMERKLCGQLSKGYRQRLGIAQAIIHRPPVIILDEPTNGLDPVQIREVRKLITELQGNHTVLLSTHILAEVTAVCSEVIIMTEGQILIHERLEELTKGQSLEHYFLEAISRETAPETVAKTLAKTAAETVAKTVAGTVADHGSVASEMTP